MKLAFEQVPVNIIYPPPPTNNFFDLQKQTRRRRRNDAVVWQKDKEVLVRGGTGRGAEEE
jgi:hypothetical protein